MENLKTKEFNPARCILPKDEYKFKHWLPGNEIDINIRRVALNKLGEKTKEGEKARQIFIKDLERSKPLNMNTYAGILTGKNLIALLKEAGEKFGSPILKPEELHLLEVVDERINIPQLAREEIQKLLQ